MIVNANIPINGKLPRDWAVYDSVNVKFPTNIIWADDESNQYGIIRRLDNTIVETTYQARKVLILPPLKLIVLNPIPDSNMFYDIFRIMNLPKAK